MPRPRSVSRSSGTAITNSELARIFNEIGDMLEIQGEVVFKAVAYRRVADVIERLNARGLRGAEVGVVELAQHVRGACIKCGAENWLTGPDWQAAGRAA